MITRPSRFARAHFQLILVFLMAALLWLPAVQAAQVASLWVVDLDAFAGDGRAGAVFFLDPRVSGGTTQTTLAAQGFFIEPDAIAMEHSGTLVVTDRSALTVVRVNSVGGAQTIVSSGGNFVDPSGIGVEADGSLVVADGGANAIIRVNASTGVQTIVSSGGLFSYPFGIAVEASGDLAVVDADNGNLIRVNPSTGAQTMLSHGANLVSGLGVTIDADGTLLVAESGTQAIVRVDPTVADDGLGTNQTVVSSGGSLITPTGLDVDADGSILVADLDAGAIIRVNPSNGAQTTVNSGGSFSAPFGLTFPQPPLPASNLTATPVAGIKRVDLTWTDVSTRNDLYAVQRAVGNGPWQGLATVGDVTAYSDTKNLAGGQTYHYRVIAALDSVLSVSSNVADVTIALLPAAPTGLSATPSATQKRVDLAWTDNATNEQGQWIHRKEGAGPFVFLAALAAGVTSYVDTKSLVGGTTYTWRVSAYNTWGSTSATDTEATPAVPNAPTALTATPQVGPRRVDLAWEDNSGNENGMRVYRQVNGGASTFWGSLAANTTTFTDTRVTAGSNYRYFVSAFNAWGEASSALTDPVSP